MVPDIVELRFERRHPWSQRGSVKTERGEYHSGPRRTGSKVAQSLATQLDATVETSRQADGYPITLSFPQRLVMANEDTDR